MYISTLQVYNETEETEDMGVGTVDHEVIKV